MEIKEPELSNVIQNASHRIYNKMLKNVEYLNENETHDAKDWNNTGKDGYRRTNPNIYLHSANGFQNNGHRLSDLSSDDVGKSGPYYKPSSPALNPYNINDTGGQYHQKNAICSLDLSEGEAAASKLQDLRLVKGLSKSLADNLNGQLRPTSNEEYSVAGLSLVNTASPIQLRTRIPRTRNGILAY